MDSHTGQEEAGRIQSPEVELSEDVRRAYGLDAPTERNNDGFVTESDEEQDGAYIEDGRRSNQLRATASRHSYHSRPFAPLTPTRPRLRRLRTGSPTRQSTNSPQSHRRTPRSLNDNLQYPLILLHVSLLPVSLPWSYRSLQSLLPPKTWKNLQYLESKISATMVQRGLLIPHPEGDFDLLVERLLEALDLGEGRVTKCGHFRRPVRLSVDSIASLSSDSGLGSSVSDFEDRDACETCGEVVEDSIAGSRAWTVRVFAANGLMGREAWSAAWREMESVDIEMVPRIDGETRRLLEERKREEAGEEAQREEEEERRVREMVEEQVRLAYERAKTSFTNEERRRQDASPESGIGDVAEEHLLDRRSDLPAIYRPKDIPLSILLRNYIYLLAQDWRNVAMVCMALLILVLALARGPGSTPTTLTAASNNSQRVGGVTTPMSDVARSARESASAVVPQASTVIQSASASASSQVHSGIESVIDYALDQSFMTASPVYSLAKVFEPETCSVLGWT